MHEGHRERLRNRFLRDGLEGFEEHNALELLLFYARARCDTNGIAHALINRFGGFDAVLDAPLEELVQVEGVGQNTATLLKMIPAMGAYYLNSKAKPGMVLDSTQKAGAFFVPKFMGKSNEEVYVAALDDKRKVLRCVRLGTEGVGNAVTLSTKQVVEEAVRTGATSMILAHNHPLGLALPSANDKDMTTQIYRALQMIHVELIDHLIIAGEEFVSLADTGFMRQLQLQ